MPGRLPLPATALAVLLVTACTSAPTAQQPPPTPTPSATTWSSDQQAAITAATAQYKKSRAAYNAALNTPTTATRSTLAAAGMSGTWLDDATELVALYRRYNVRLLGAPTIVSTTPTWVDLTAAQPAVVLTTCLDYSHTKVRNPAGTGPIRGKRRLIDARMLRLPTGWSLTSESSSTENAKPSYDAHLTC